MNYRARVWLNGKFLGEHRDGFLPFEYEIQGQARWDGDNILAVSVDNAHHEGDVPGMHVGWRGYGGILREVRLCATDLLHIEEARAIAVPGAQGGEIELRARVRNARSVAVDASLEVTIHDVDGTIRKQLSPRPVRLEADAAASVTVKGTLVDARAWCPSSPTLYWARTQLKVHDRTADELHTTFGFRRIEATPDGLLLNDKPIFLTGFNRHEDSPRTAMAVDLETTWRDLEDMKEAGANFVRLCHYPHNPAELDMCDEIGLLAFCEIPLYFWNNVDEGRRTNPARVQTASRQLKRMIERDYNHPSIIFWSVSNETHDDELEVRESNCELIRTTRALDPTRLCVHVSNQWMSYPSFDEDDVICVNAYPSLDIKDHGHVPDSDAKDAAEFWRTELAKLHQTYPSKPILVTEFGYCSFADTHSHAFGEDEHAKALEAEFAAIDETHVCGATIWCWADHPWPAGRFRGGLSISPFGVVGRDRRKLKPFWAARRMFRARQGLEETPQSSGT